MRERREGGGGLADVRAVHEARRRTGRQRADDGCGDLLAALGRQAVDGPQSAVWQQSANRLTKPIGPVYPEQEARRLAAAHSWTIARDGKYFHASSPRPEPRAIVELEAVERLLDAGAVVVWAGGGGIPIVASTGGRRGIEAVIDKDLTAALLAEALEADKLIMLTDVPSVERDWGKAYAAPIESTTPAELRMLSFAAGSMGPKVEAACRFVERTGGEAAGIGSLQDVAAIVRGEAGTQLASAVAASTP